MSGAPKTLHERNKRYYLIVEGLYREDEICTCASSFRPLPDQESSEVAGRLAHAAFAASPEEHIQRQGG